MPHQPFCAQGHVTETTACPSRGWRDKVPARKHPSQSQFTTKKKSRGSVLVGVPASGLSLCGCCFSPATVLWTSFGSRVGRPKPSRSPWRAWRLLQTPPRRPCSWLGSWSREQPAALAASGRPGLCRGCRAPPRPGWEESLVSGVGLETAPSHHCRGRGWEFRAVL